VPQIPEQIRPYLDVVRKHHFWMLAGIVPLVLLPLLYMGTGAIDKQIAGRKQEIDGKVSGLTGIKGIAPHPNERWTTVLEEQTQKIRAETLAEWERLWKDQAALRSWPKLLGDDFIKAITTLKPGGTLTRQMLLRYQNKSPELARTLPERMGADNLMTEGAAAAAPGMAGPDMMPGGPRGPLGGPGGGGFGPRPGMGGDFRPGAGGPQGVPPGGSNALVQWSQADQVRLLDSFTFNTADKRCGKDVISTAQVLLAQEELWVYGLLCDAIRTLNTGADGPLTSPIGTVLELAVGYPAAEQRVGGQDTGRILLPAQAPVPGGDFGMAGGPGAEFGAPGEGGGATGGKPGHPRFKGTAGGPGAGDMGVEGGAAPSAPEDQIREWIYVDFTGKPLSAAELATAPAVKLVHLMPFTLRVAMDQRKIDALLVELAKNPVPIDVRQVRVNPGQQAGGVPGGPGGGGAYGPPPSVATTDGAGLVPGRPHDVIVELRGSVGVAPAPDPQVLGGGEQPPAGGGA